MGGGWVGGLGSSIITACAARPVPPAAAAPSGSSVPTPHPASSAIATIPIMRFMTNILCNLCAAYALTALARSITSAAPQVWLRIHNL